MQTYFVEEYNIYAYVSIDGLVNVSWGVAALSYE